MSAHSVNASRRRRASDWAGFLGHFGIAVLTVVRTPSLTLYILPSVVHMLLAAGSFLVRDSPRRREQDPVGRIVSYAGGFGVFAFAQFASVFKPEWIAVTANPVLGLVGIFLGLTGLFVEIWAIWHLRFAFATEPAARRLVTSGPYRMARHPIYSGACLAYLGLLMSHPTMPLVVALIGWIVCVRLRMQYEEAILTAAFPEYEEYRRRVGALLPWSRPLGAGPRETPAPAPGA